jgi:hypothetical protein
LEWSNNIVSTAHGESLLAAMPSARGTVRTLGLGPGSLVDLFFLPLENLPLVDYLVVSKRSRLLLP